MKIYTTGLLSCALLGALALWSSPSGKEQLAVDLPETAAAFSLTISSPRDSIQVGSPVKVKVILTNISGHDISLWHENAEDQGGWVYKIDIHDERGRIPPETELGRRIRLNTTDIADVTPEDFVGHRSGASSALGSGKTEIDMLNVSRLYNLTQPVKYTIQVERFDDISKTEVKSNTIVVSIVNKHRPEDLKEPTVSLTLFNWPSGSVVKAGSRIIVTVVKKNNADEEIDNSRSAVAAYNYDMNVRDEHGNSVPETKELRELRRPELMRRNAKLIHEKLEPHRAVGQFSEAIPISDYYEMSRPGTYTIQVSQADPKTGNEIKSNTIAVQVVQ